MCVFLYLSLRSGTQVGRPPRNAREFSLTGRAAHALPAYLADVSPGASACGRLRSQVLIMLLGLRWRYNLTCMRCSSRARCGGALKRRAWHRPDIGSAGPAPPLTTPHRRVAHRTFRTRLACVASHAPRARFPCTSSQSQAYYRINCLEGLDNVDSRFASDLSTFIKLRCGGVSPGERSLGKRARPPRASP